MIAWIADTLGPGLKIVQRQRCGRIGELNEFRHPVISIRFLSVAVTASQNAIGRRSFGTTTRVRKERTGIH